MSKTVEFNHEILNAEYGWNVSDNALDTMFINDWGELLTGEWNEYHERCSDHSEYYQDATQDPDIEYIEPIMFEPESNTFIIPDRETNYDEDEAMLKIAEAIDENLLDCCFEGDNEYVGAMEALFDAGAGAETCILVYMQSKETRFPTCGGFNFIDEDEYDELDDYERVNVFYTNDGRMFLVSE